MAPLTPLKLARLEAGKSQWDVSKETGIAQTTISLYEREYREPTRDHKRILAKLYRKKLADIWG